MYCKNCGYIMDDGTPVCPVCGMKINVMQNTKKNGKNQQPQNGALLGMGNQHVQNNVPQNNVYPEMPIQPDENNIEKKNSQSADNQSLLKKMAIFASVIVLVGLIACVLVDHFVGGRDISKSAEKPVKSVQKTENKERGADGAYDMQDADLGDDLDDQNAQYDDRTWITEAITDEIGDDDSSQLQNSTEASSQDTTEPSANEEDKTARYKAYYEIVKTYMKKYPCNIRYGTGLFSLRGLNYVDLVDFNGDGKEQLVLAYMEMGTKSNYDYKVPQIMVFDFVEGKAKNILTHDAGIANFGNSYDVSYGSDGEKKWLFINYNADGQEDSNIDINARQIEYVDGTMVKTHWCTKKQTKYTDDGSYVSDSAVFYNTDDKYATEDIYNDTVAAMKENLTTYLLKNTSNGINPTNSDMEGCVTIAKKNETIRILAEAVGDLEVYDEDKIVISEDGDSLIYNKYNESYIFEISGSLDITYSDKGNVIHVVNDSPSADYDLCMIYEDGVLKLAGCNDLKGFGKPSWFVGKLDGICDVQERLNIVENECQISEEEYNKKVSEIMSTY